MDKNVDESANLRFKKGSAFDFCVLQNTDGEDERWRYSSSYNS